MAIAMPMLEEAKKKQKNREKFPYRWPLWPVACDTHGMPWHGRQLDGSPGQGRIGSSQDAMLCHIYLDLCQATKVISAY